jgi:ABC-type transport system involved in multi-copper enzyme maturation permease subunit
MTTLTVPARLEQNANLRPLAWRRMVWVTWRQHRLALLSVAALLGALALTLWIVGLQLRHAYGLAIACHPASSPACGEALLGFNNMDAVLRNGLVLQALPALIGAFVGAPLLARELETGTFRYAWTQGFGRWRWTLAKLVALGLVLVAITGALSVLFSWYYQPYFAPRNPVLAFSEMSPLAGGLFDLRGVTFAAWTLAALAIGALAGLLIRRVVPAIIATLAVYAGLAFVATRYLRSHYLTALITTNLNLPGSAWIVSQWGTRGGRFAFAGGQNIGGLPSNLLMQLCPSPTVAAKPSVSPAQCLAQHGYTLWTSYEPASRFWPFQWIEGGWLLALSLLLIAVTVWLVRRRAI